MCRRNFFEISAELTPITHRNFYRASFRRPLFFGALFIAANCFLYLGVIGQGNVKSHQQGTVGGLNVSQPARRLFL